MDMFATRTMLPAVQQSKTKAKTWLRDRYFGEDKVKTYTTKKVDIDLVGGDDRKIAPFVNPKVSGVVMTKDGYRTTSYEAPEVNPMRSTSAEDLLNRSPGETVYSSKSPDERAAEELGKDLSYLAEKIDRREEVMCSEALFYGQVTVKGEGYDEVIGYWDAEEGEKPFTELATPWTNASANVFDDLRAAADFMSLKGGYTPRELICGKNAAKALIERVKKELDYRRVDLGEINPRQLPNGVAYLGHLNELGLDIYTYKDWYVHPDTGLLTPIVPDNLVLMASVDAATTRAYGCCAVEEDDEIKHYEGTRIPSSWVEKNPCCRMVQIKSRPLPIINQIHGFHVLDVIGS